MVPAHLIDINAPLASAFVLRGLHALSGIISLGAVAGLTSVLLVLLLGQSRIFFRGFARRSAAAGLQPDTSAYRTPYIPTTLTGFAVGITAALLPIQEIAELTNIGTLFAFVLVCLGVWILRRVEPDLKRPFRTPLVPLVPILGVVFLRLPDGELADGNVDPVFRLDGDWAGDLFQLRPLPQQGAAARGR